MYKYYRVDIHGPRERSGLPLIRARIGILPLMPESMSISCYHWRYSRDRQSVCAKILCYALLCIHIIMLSFNYLTLRTHQTGYDRRTHYASLGLLKKVPGKCTPYFVRVSMYLCSKVGVCDSFNFAFIDVSFHNFFL